MSDSLQPHELQHARPPCPSPTAGGHRRSSWSSTQQHRWTGGKGQWSGDQAGWGSETHQGAAPGIRGQDGQGTNGVLPRRLTWQRHSRGTEPTVEVGWPLVTAKGPEAIQNDPEAKQLLRPTMESNRQKPPAQEWSPGTLDVYCPSWPPWRPPLGSCAHHHQHPEPQLAQRTLSRCVPAPPQPSRATCCAQLSPLGTEGTSLPRDATGHGGQGGTPHEARPVRS